MLLMHQWPNGLPPSEWPRILAVDVGGSTPWAWIWSAIDPFDNVITYDEIYETTSDVSGLIRQALPKMKDENGNEYNFKAKVIDYENKIAATDLQRGGITMTNARKVDKASSIERLKSYFHPNPLHHFPPWHPHAGLPGSPRWFVMARCKNVRREIPQARWLERDSIFKDEMDRRTGNHTVDCLLYQCRELPPPWQLKPTPSIYQATTHNKNKMSELYHYDARQREKNRQAEQRRPYRIFRQSLGMLD